MPWLKVIKYDLAMKYKYSKYQAGSDKKRCL